MYTTFDVDSSHTVVSLESDLREYALRELISSNKVFSCVSCVEG